MLIIKLFIHCGGGQGPQGTLAREKAWLSGSAAPITSCFGATQAPRWARRQCGSESLAGVQAPGSSPSPGV